MKIKENIIHQSLSLFLKKGVKQVNMDEVASNLGISKKTLYIHFDNKQDLVHTCFQRHNDVVAAMINNSAAQFDNAIDELFAIDESCSLVMKQTNPYLLGELKRYYPNTWSLIEDLKQKVLFNIMKNNLNNGIEQELYRSELDVEIIAKLMISRTDALVNDELFPLTHYDFRKLLTENRIYHIRGIATSKGINYLEQKIYEE
jgi:TetR/AcrR family transcriptional regulator, cholesterol catabolism regulator